MTKKWSSTRSMDGQTKQQASKRYRREFVEELLRISKEQPEATFDSIDDVMNHLNQRPVSLE